jgi:imidazoleglycerol-phosphate dehydratase
MKRKTRETSIQVRVRPAGRGTAKLDLEDRWLKHMLEAMAKFSGMDLEVRARGDFLHHINEDVAITLGREFRRTIDRMHVRRLGTATVAMDDALVLVSVDLVDRPFFDAQLPDEMLEHFLRSFAMEARITLHNLVLKGKNHHHIHEATFKALGLALREAMESSGGRLMSTKGKARWGK